MARTIPIGAFLLVWSSVLLAQEKPLIEEIIVAAQRVEENAQKVPIAVSAFDDAMLQDRQIIGILDVQYFVPNLSATTTNPGTRELTIRGVGPLVDSSFTPQDSVSYHVNQVPQRFVSLIEFYDLERLEILRGPQGTLFGRNSTAGAVNATTKRPAFEGPRAQIDIEIGNHGLRRLRGVADLQFGDEVAIRFAGLNLDRDGYIKNLADGQVPNVDDDLDGRDLYSFRVTPEWRITDTTTLWLMFQRDVEDDDRARISNQVCVTNPLPTTGCLPDEFGLEPVHPSASSWGIYAGLNGLIPLGARDASTGLMFDFPRPPLSLREQHTDFEPVYENEVDTWILGVEHGMGRVDISFLGSYSESKYLSQQDRFMDVGYTLVPTTFNPSGLWPTSRAPTEDPGNPFAGLCPLLEGKGGIHGGCIFDADQTRFFTYEQISGNGESWSAELKAATNFDGPLNGLLGVQYIDSSFDFDLHTPSNVFTAISAFGNPADPPGFGPPLYMGFDGSASQTEVESVSVFGELYWQPADGLKITAGIRYTDDVFRSKFMGIDFQSFDGTQAVIQLPGDSPRWLRFTFVPWFLSGAPDDAALALTDYYGVTQAAISATTADELAGVLEVIPPVAPFGEVQDLFGIPDRYSTDAITGRLGIDWQPGRNSMVYAFYSRGHNPGGISGLNQTFDDEKVDAFEVGSKSLLLNDSLLINVAAFYNIHDDMHFDQFNNTFSGIGNLDAEVWGAEVEARWRPTHSLDLQLAYGWLESSIDKVEVVDLLDPTAGNTDFVLLRDPGGDLFVAPRDLAALAAPFAISSGAAWDESLAPGTVYPDGIPAYFSRSFLEGVGIPTVQGLPSDIEGNRTPKSPRHSLHLGLAYTWFIPMGSLTARWDYYWQDETYTRIYNRPGDRIDSWDQHNASLAFASSSGRWSIRAWVRNIEDDENVTDHYLGSELAGPYRNYFLAEPRVYGATLSLNLGSQ